MELMMTQMKYNTMTTMRMMTICGMQLSETAKT